MSDNGIFTFDATGGEVVTVENNRLTYHVLFLLDCSGSMGGFRINQLNAVVPMAIRVVCEAAESLEANAVIRAIAFSDYARWVLGDEAHGLTPDEAWAQWEDLSADGSTNTAEAIRLGLTMMHTRYLGWYSLRPVVILMSAGESNNGAETQAAIEELRMAFSGGNPKRKDTVWRIALGVENYDREELEKFAMVGDIENEFGDLLENQPMVFAMEDVLRLSRVLSKICPSMDWSEPVRDDGEEPIVPDDMVDL